MKSDRKLTCGGLNAAGMASANWSAAIGTVSSQNLIG